MDRAKAKALFVFLFMAFLAAQAGTGFMRALFAGGVYLRAMRAFDWILETFVTGPLGRTGGAIALLVLGFGFAVLVWRRAAREHAFMSGKVWMSSVLGNYQLGDKLGLRAKFYNHEWNPATLKVPISPDEVYEAAKRHAQGFSLKRSEFTGAVAVFDEKRFSRVGDLFYAGPFFAVKGKLAEVLSRFDLGEGGLIPFTIYKADLTTPADGEYFLLNFGARKNTILPEESEML